ncbi:MAG: bifunctional metallophosphatase/5'-nucleotidase [Rhodoferax sp.]|nr:bifunctional metallophosphatase/5'-nucleotidase [Rhodoferax sp.]
MQCRTDAKRFYLAKTLGRAARWALAPLLLLLVAGAGAAEPVHISLVAINDFHGNIQPPAGSLLMPDAGHAGGTRVAAGGAAYLSSLVRELKGRNPGRTLVVGAGDLVGATPLASGLFHDEPTIEVLNQIGLDVSSVGNHEFDKGRTELLRLQNGGCFPRADDGSNGVVGVDTCMNGGSFAGARFQYLAANVLVNSTGQTLFPATALREVGGVKIGFIGLTLRATPSVVTPAGVIGLQFQSEVATVNRLAPQLKAQGAAAVVVLIHQGGQTSARTVQDKSCPDFSGPILDLADQFVGAVDVVVSGHTHQEYVCTRPDGKLLTQTGFYGRLVTLIDLQVDAQTNKVVAKDANNHVVLNGGRVADANGNPVPLPTGASALAPDPAVEAIVRRYGDLTAPLSDMEVGRLYAPLERRQNAAGESTLGAIVADAFLAGTSDSSLGQRPAQIAFTNPGGLRSDLPTLAVTFGQLYNVLPFNNNLVTMDLTGRQILRLLEQQWERPQPAGGRILPVSQGFTYTWDASQPEGATPGIGHRVVPGSMRLHGEVMEMDKLYRVTVNSFMASGGDSFNVFRHGLNMQEGDSGLAVAKLYLRLKGVLPSPAMGRIQRVN